MKRDENLLKESIVSAQCPDIEVLLESISASGMVSDDLQPHIRQCPRCQAEVELFEEFQRGEVAPAEETDVSWIEERMSMPGPRPIPRTEAAPHRWSWKPLLGLAAAAALGAVLLNLPLRQTLPELTDPVGPITVRSGQVSLTGPRDLVAEMPREFLFASVDSADSYLVQVFEVDGRELWSGSTPAPPLAVPREVQDVLVPGKRLLWQVTALDASGSRLASSQRVAFWTAATTGNRR